VDLREAEILFMHGSAGVAETRPESVAAALAASKPPAPPRHIHLTNAAIVQRSSLSQYAIANLVSAASASRANSPASPLQIPIRMPSTCGTGNATLNSDRPVDIGLLSASSWTPAVNLGRPGYADWNYWDDLVRILSPKSPLPLPGGGPFMDEDGQCFREVVEYRLLLEPSHRWSNVVQHRKCLLFLGGLSVSRCLVCRCGFCYPLRVC
jgi:hypothetical protein